MKEQIKRKEADEVRVALLVAGAVIRASLTHTHTHTHRLRLRSARLCVVTKSNGGPRVRSTQHLNPVCASRAG